MPDDRPASIDLLASALDRAGSPLCLGLDPDPDRIPASIASASEVERARDFCFLALEAAAPHVGVVKPQAACFERFGWPGVSVLEDVCRRARDLGLYVLLDAKRGDIGVSTRHYAAAAANMGAHAITANAYLGAETLTPYLDAHLAVFALVRTSNPGSDAIQSARLQGNRTVAELVAAELHALGTSHVGASGLSAVGAVVGATKARDAARLREAMPGAVFLAPGVGAQGATPEDLAPFLRDTRTGIGDAGLIAPVSRALLYPEPNPGESPADAISRTAQALKQNLAALI